MEIKRILKLKKGDGTARRVDFPNSLKELEAKAKEFIPINENFQKYQFIEEMAKKEIRNQDDFDLMNKEYENEKLTKISINVIDKPIEISENNLSLSNVSQKKSDEEAISINNNIILDEIKIEEPEDKMKREIQEIVNNKMKTLEENIAQDIFQSIKLQLSKSEQNLENKKKNNIINIKKIGDTYFGIKCNNCEKENIQGIRYKCTVCPDFNLCQKCESEIGHIPNHILIKMRRPVLDDDFTDKIKMRNYLYKNGEYNYSVDDTNIIFSFGNKDSDNLVRQITLTNTGFQDWKNGALFKCLPDSELKGKDIIIENEVKRNENINVEIIFEDFKKDLISFKDEYEVYYQMFNLEEEAFGNITKFKVIFKN